MNRLITSATLLMSFTAFAQNVGINTTTPAATLDVVGKVGPTLDGIIAPRFSGSDLRAKSYTAAQTGALVYATAADTSPSGQTANVTSAGYYYFDGSLWVKAAGPVGPSGPAVEPWNVLGTTTPATANTQSIYQTGNVSVGANSGSAKLNVFNTTGNTDLTIMHLENRPASGTQWFDLMGNLKQGDYTYLSNAGDQAIIFDVGNNGGPPYLNSGLIIAPHVNGGSAVPYGLKIIEQGLSGFNAINPSETLDIGGTFRVRKLPLNGSANAIFTNPSGSNSLGTSATGPASNNSAPVPTQTFTAVNTVVADANGVLGYVSGLPKTAVAAPADNTGTGSVGTPVSLGVSSANFVPSLISFNPSSTGATGYNFTKDGSGNWVLNFTGPSAGTSVAYGVTWIAR